ncbi:MULTISPECIES: LacI family DNA-binding transcriptional regulator [unclassified Rathayibacter]|uniref:LacI family DNA-binding transcriptional regulator n=1 Tax=unclassified Rathayibacter TaxID=2609250 RepID=UPI0010498123|nr:MULTISPECIES: LacI family DNA-binding transcriptional regulator [unclassified Rathayibacter]MCJ1704081.1 LacI family transcriptional regulator [Rathayibacter sp. VKM Ac-2926]TCL83264.1 DNA-binding LacI/PurR family transcriptional regulator [Rathayibacter sp. PhB192]TCM28762.1 DNA-binding LacI/PurR family transcriptional regulator [Rathayibacter sp. PhB179]
MSRITLKDIATRAGVSVSTVSYALNDQSTVVLASETKTRIRMLARTLGYVPNGLARSLQARSSRTIGVLLNKPLTTPRYAEIAQGLSEGLAARGFHLALLDGDSADNCVEDARGGRLEGLVFIGHDDHEVPADLARAVVEHRVPFTALDCGSTADTAWATIDFDYAAGVEELISHLREEGVTRIVHVLPQVTSRADRVRTTAMAAATSSHGLSCLPVSTGMTDDLLTRLESDPSAGSDYSVDITRRLDEAAAAILAHDTDTTALVCSWGADVEAVYRWAAMTDAGLRVAALAGGQLDPRLWTRLTYSRLPLRRAGEIAAGLIIDARDPGTRASRITLAPTLDTGGRSPRAHDTEGPR